MICHCVGGPEDNEEAIVNFLTGSVSRLYALYTHSGRHIPELRLFAYCHLLITEVKMVYG